MPGLNLGANFGVAAAMPASYAGSSFKSGGGTDATTISARAYGIQSAGAGVPGPATAGFGSVAVGALSTAFLVWLWWTLPR